MTTYREAIYMCLDLIKGNSDDFSYTEDHVAYLLDKFRALLLKQRYGNDPKKHVPYSNYQTIEIELIPPGGIKANQIVPGPWGTDTLKSTYPVASNVSIIIDYALYNAKEGTYETRRNSVVLQKGTSEVKVPTNLIGYSIETKQDFLYIYYSNMERPENIESRYDSKYYISKNKIPYTLQLGIPRITTDEYHNIQIEFTSRERLPYVGYNKYLKNIRYCAINQEGYLCVTTKNADPIEFDEINKLFLTAIFENPREVKDEKSFNEGLDELDRNIPIEESLITTLIEMVVKELLGAAYRPADNSNDANDDMASIANFLASNMKKDFVNQMQS